MKKNLLLIITLAAVISPVIYFMAPRPAGAHCDTMDGPVIKAAQAALEKGDITPALKWVKKDDEPAIKEAFRKTLAVRAKGPEVKELADMYFFETLVRIHRAGEGAAYDGIKPTGVEIEPPVAATDKALENGSPEETIKLINRTVAEGLKHRFANANEKKKRADESVEAGRAYVAAYVEFVHYAEGVYAAAAKTGHGHSAESGESNPHGDKH